MESLRINHFKILSFLRWIILGKIFDENYIIRVTLIIKLVKKYLDGVQSHDPFWTGFIKIYFLSYF